MTTKLYPAATRISGCVQLGKISFEGWLLEDGSVEYKVTAPVVGYYGQVPKAGAKWTLQHGTRSNGDSLEKVQADQMVLYRDYMLVGYQGNVKDWPYKGYEVD